MPDTKPMREALRRVQHYVAMRRAKPLLGLGDSIHGIHAGTEWAAELLFSDLCVIADHGAALAADEKGESELVAALRKAIESAFGYMVNAKIDLETGAPKKTALNTIDGGIKLVRAALAKHANPEG